MHARCSVACIHTHGCMHARTHTHTSVLFKETYDVLRRETPTIWAWGKDVKPRIWAPGGLPAKTDQGHFEAFDGQKPASEIEIFVKMVGSPERKRTKQGESDGRYKRGESMVRPEPCSLHG